MRIHPQGQKFTGKISTDTLIMRKEKTYSLERYGAIVERLARIRARNKGPRMIETYFEERPPDFNTFQPQVTGLTISGRHPRPLGGRHGPCPDRLT